MLANDITPERLRRLATHGGEGKVLSVFLNLDPREFATAPARASQVTSVLDRARITVGEQEGLSHDEHEALKADLQRVRDELESAPDVSGARGLAVFASSPSQLFEVLRLPAPVDHEPVVGDAPYVEPVAALGHQERWAVVLVNRSFARLLYGSRDVLEELALVDNDVHGRHQQGGWSQARYQRSVEQDVEEHLREVAELTTRRMRDGIPSGLIVGGPEETVAEFVRLLPADLQQRMAGRLSIDVEHSVADEVRAAAAEMIDATVRRQEEELLGRLKQGLGGAPETPAVAGLADTLLALTEQRVGALLVDAGTSAPGVVCPQCGLLATEGSECPADGTPLERRDDILPDAIDRAIAQDARVVVLRERPDLGPHEHVAAILRF